MRQGDWEGGKTVDTKGRRGIQHHDNDNDNDDDDNDNKDPTMTMPTTTTTTTTTATRDAQQLNKVKKAHLMPNIL